MSIHCCFHCNTLNIYIVDIHSPAFQKEYTVVILWHFFVYLCWQWHAAQQCKQNTSFISVETCLIIFMPCSEEKVWPPTNMPQCYVICILSILLSMTSFSTYQLTGVHQQWIHLQRDVQRVSVSVTVPQALTHPTAALGGWDFWTWTAHFWQHGMMWRG